MYTVAAQYIGWDMINIYTANLSPVQHHLIASARTRTYTHIIVSLSWAYSDTIKYDICRCIGGTCLPINTCTPDPNIHRVIYTWHTHPILYCVYPHVGVYKKKCVTSGSVCTVMQLAAFEEGS